MSIRTLFENIADAIKEKNPSITTVTPSQMPQAIRGISGGDVELMTETEWNNLTVAEKLQKGLVAIEKTSTGFYRGDLVNGANYALLEVYQNYVNLGEFSMTQISNNVVEIIFTGVGSFNGLVLNCIPSVSSISFNVITNNTTIECGVCNNNGTLPSIIQLGANRVWYHDYLNTATGAYGYTSFNNATMRLYITSYTASNVSFKVQITIGE